jgi:thiol-disulfide isomerase/thioredoxin
MKKSSLLFLFVFFVSTLLTHAQSNKFRLEGTILNYDSLKSYGNYATLWAFAQSGEYHLQKSRVKIENNKFVFEGTVSHPILVTINTDNIRGGLGVWLTNDTIKAQFSVEESTNIDGAKRSLLKTNSVEGSKESQDNLALVTENNNIRSQEQNPLKRNSLVCEMLEKYVDNHTNSYLSLFQLQFTINECGATKSQSLFDKLTDELKKSRDGISVQRQIKTQEQNTVGNTIPDFSMPNQDGTKIQISSEIKDWTIINFWASWCGPCRLENEHLVKIKKKLDSKSVKIIGVSLDSNRDAWVKAIEKDKAKWLQLSDLSGEFDSEIAKKFKISSVPYIILVDKDLKILATEYNEIMKLIESK